MINKKIFLKAFYFKRLKTKPFIRSNKLLQLTLNCLIKMLIEGRIKKTLKNNNFCYINIFLS